MRYVTRITPLIVLPSLIFIAFIPTLSGQFILDDIPFVKENPYIQEFHSPLSYLSQEDGIIPNGADSGHSGYYRPLVNLTYTIDFKIWGLKPMGFRMTNLLLHIATCLLLYQFLMLLTEKRIGALWAVLLFAFHPANTEAVSWVTSRNNILVTFFGLGAIYFYIKRERGGVKWVGAMSLLCFAAALLSKEFAVMLLPILFLYNLLIPSDRERSKGEYFDYIAFGLLILCYMALRKVATQSFITPCSNDQLLKGFYFAPYLLTYYLRIILLPYGLHNFVIGYSDDSFTKEAIFGFFCLGLVGLLLWRNRSNRFLLFSALSFITALFPVLHIIPTTSVSLVSMRWLYFPMVFPCVALAQWLGKNTSLGEFSFQSVLLGLVVLYLGLYTYILNQNLWANEKRFFEKEVVLFGNNFFAGDLARIYQLKGFHRKADLYYRKAISSYPDKPKTYINYAAFLVEIKKPKAALYFLEKAERLNPLEEDQAKLYNNKGVAYFQMRNYDDSIKSFLKAVEIMHQNPDFLINLGTVYGVIGEHEKAVSVFKRCLNLDTDKAALRRKIGHAYMAMGDSVNAARFLGNIHHEIQKGR
ncbi:MAG: hypothetical protein DRH11_12700 [Deltaproteobacteria bacterium]|nr:MAG: hypothetical protein DRH11_12700 [Deltaproteobacteria bacterium]